MVLLLNSDAVSVYRRLFGYVTPHWKVIAVAVTFTMPITPLLGLLGTVIGMVKVFAAITLYGVGNPGVLAGGISEALITTAAGLSVAIPSLIGYRYLRGRVDNLVVQMEKEAMTFLQVLVQHQRAEVVGNEASEPLKRSA